MRKKHREKIIDLTSAVLEGILTLGGATFNAFIDQRSFYQNFDSDDFSRRQITDRVRNLINSGYIEAKEESGHKSIRLTRKGKIKRLEKSQDVTADGQWRFISFDIPEKYKNLRLQLVRYLRRIGYKPIQKSLWASPFVKVDEVDLIIKELGVSQYVAYFVIEKTDIQEHLKELFDDEIE